jgi:catalase
MVREALLDEGALPVLVAPRLGPLIDSNGSEHWVEQSLLTGSSVLFDAVYVPGGLGINALAEERDAIDWISEAYRHCKPIAVSAEGLELLRLCPEALDGGVNESPGGGGESRTRDGVLVSDTAPTDDFVATFVAMIAQHRFWERAGRNRLRGATGDRETRGCDGREAAPGSSPIEQPHA